jgi:thiol:disulfide interchange protein
MPLVSTLSSIPYSLWLPLLSIVALAAAVLIALFAWLFGVKRTRRVNAWDVAAALAFIGCAAAILGEIEHVAEYFLLDNRWSPAARPAS